VDLSTPPPLELSAVVYNINQGHNEAMLHKSENLNGYSAFINKAREFEKELDDLSVALKKAVEYCIDHNILKEFLELHSSEVINMLFAEWKDEEALEYRYNEGFNKGLTEGLNKGRNEGLTEGLNKGLNKGRNEDIKNLLAFGMSTGQIAQALKLPLDTVLQHKETK
jgi:predicted transposase/invertase (TIGR01784 family)